MLSSSDPTTSNKQQISGNGSYPYSSGNILSFESSNSNQSIQFQQPGNYYTNNNHNGLDSVAPHQSAISLSDMALSTKKQQLLKHSSSNQPSLMETSPQIYSAVYSGVPVFEMVCRNVAVMRRRSDSYLNATQILKVAGIDKGRRTKILEKEILNGEHEKVQGGYGKYQGTWIPYDRGIQLAQYYGVDQHLRAILEFDPPIPGQRPVYNNRDCQPKPNSAEAKRQLLQRQSSINGYSDEYQPTQKKARKNSSSGDSARKRKEDKNHDSHGLEINHPFSYAPVEIGHALTPAPSFSNSSSSGLEVCDLNFQPERHRNVLMSIFLNEDPNYIPEILTSQTPPPDLDVNLIIDEQGHTALHWAAALARINILALLLSKSADVNCRNFNGESALIRSVLVTHNYDNSTFHNVVEMLNRAIPLLDNRNRSVIHHIALTAGIQGRAQASRYYMECILEKIAREGGDFRIVDVQDQNGDTALNIAARIGNRNLVDQLLEVGADQTLENRAGLRPCDFGIDAYQILARDEMMFNECVIVDNNDEKEGDDGINQLGSNFDPLTFSSPDEIIGGSGKGGLSGQASDYDESLKNYAAKVVFPVIRPDSENEEFLSQTSELNTRREFVRHAIEEKLKAVNPGSSMVVTKLFDELTVEYMKELRIRFDQLKDTESSLREATKELSQVRKTNQVLQTENSKLPILVEKIASLEECYSKAPEVYVASEDQTQDVKDLIKALNERQETEVKLRQEIVKLKQHSGEKALKYRKAVAACANVPLENVDTVIDELLTAIESDDGFTNISQLANFMTRVKGQERGTVKNSGESAGKSSNAVMKGNKKN